jgi:hypothetical protein
MAFLTGGIWKNEWRRVRSQQSEKFQQKLIVDMWPTVNRYSHQEGSRAGRLRIGLGIGKILEK